MNKRINQYIADYEEFDLENNENSKNDDLNDEMKTLMIEILSFSSFDKFSATKTFMIVFESMKTSKIMIIDLKAVINVFVAEDLSDDEDNENSIINVFISSFKSSFFEFSLFSRSNSS